MWKVILEHQDETVGRILQLPIECFIMVIHFTFLSLGILLLLTKITIVHISKVKSFQSLPDTHIHRGIWSSLI